MKFFSYELLSKNLELILIVVRNYTKPELMTPERTPLCNFRTLIDIYPKLTSITVSYSWSSRSV